MSRATPCPFWAPSTIVKATGTSSHTESDWRKPRAPASDSRSTETVRTAARARPLRRRIVQAIGRLPNRRPPPSPRLTGRAACLSVRGSWCASEREEVKERGRKVVSNSV
ncbi:hypothetical protein chiPu_0002299 [Chiloscyllium punctatum]|uniref:Uncharacterized protein n=1 Tax=Chiloscyllium punctatum TaxID=137246 RepID=A0A401S0F9_CHIPU|nr:hypothetical protein [Chiloscyllium punctatum]